jgi:hypothetical protein
MATQKSSKELVLIARFSFKTSNAVVYKLRSNVPNKKGKIEGRDQVERGGKFYDCYEVSCNEDYVCGCQSSNEQCKSNLYRGTCSHRTFVQGLIDRRQNVESSSQDVELPVVELKPREVSTDLSTKGNFGSRPFSILKPAS